PVVALLQEGVEIGGAAAKRGVLEDRREITRLALATTAEPRGEIALLHVGALHRIAPCRLLAIRFLHLSAAVGRRLLLIVFAGDREAGQAPLRQRDRWRRRERQTDHQGHRDELGLAPHAAGGGGA